MDASARSIVTPPKLTYSAKAVSGQFWARAALAKSLHAARA